MLNWKKKLIISSKCSWSIYFYLFLYILPFLILVFLDIIFLYVRHPIHIGYYGNLVQYNLIQFLKHGLLENLKLQWFAWYKPQKFSKVKNTPCYHGCVEFGDKCFWETKVFQKRINKCDDEFHYIYARVYIYLFFDKIHHNFFFG